MYAHNTVQISNSSEDSQKLTTQLSDLSQIQLLNQVKKQKA